jgi:DNA-3-methyladenine glycosylase II
MSFVAPAGATLAPEGLEEGMAELSRREPGFAEIVLRAGRPRFARRPASFGTLLHIILEQQVSIEAARAMYRNLQAACDPLAPEGFLALDEPTLRACGFSRQKTVYARGLAEALAGGRLDLECLAAMEDEGAMAALTSLKGIGPWTAEVFLLFALARPDVWPAADLGLQLAVQTLRRLPARPRTAEMREIAEPWRPWRSVAACLLWQSYLFELDRLAGPRKDRRPSSPLPGGEEILMPASPAPAPPAAPSTRRRSAGPRR